MLRKYVKLSLGSDGLTVVQPHPQAKSRVALQQGYVVARIEPAYQGHAQDIVDAINKHLKLGTT